MNTEPLEMAWMAWNRSPGNRELACRLEGLVQEASAEIGMPGSTIRDLVNRLRHRGMNLRMAIREVVG